jgi:cysteine desulfurase
MPDSDAIYLDHNATSPILPEAADAVRKASLRFRGNPASQHSAGREARRTLEAARERIAELLGAARGDRVVFTSGGTEANNLAILGLGSNQGGASLVGAGDTARLVGAGRHLIVSSIEHPSVALATNQLARQGVLVDQLAVNSSGVVRNEKLPELLRPSTRLVSVMLANNETGVRQPVTEIAAACRERGVAVHTDAVQAVGKVNVDFAALGVDAMSIAAHKFHGPLGIGALVLRHGAPLAPMLHGGFQQSGWRPGTESVALAVGMCTALEAWEREADARRERMTRLRDGFERQLVAGDPRAVVIGEQAPRLPQTSNIAFVGLDRQALVMALDLACVACSTGSACASGSSEPSPTLLAMGLPNEQISSSLRFSLGAMTTAADVDEAARRILSVVNRLRRE